MKAKVERLVYAEYINGVTFPVDTIIFRLKNGTEIACKDFRFYKGKLEVFVRVPFGKWKRQLIVGKNAEVIHGYFCKRKKDNVDYAELMKHSHAKKKPSGSPMGSSLVTTEYECSKYPLHDFPRSRYVEWN